MLKDFKYIGASFQKASIELREDISLNEEECIFLVNEIKEFTGCRESLVISTCNRTGVYYNSTKDLSEDILKLIGLKKGLPDILKHQESFVSILEHEKAAQHLYRVAMGLESQVVGDIQISNQFKRAYQISANQDMCGPFLHRIMHSVFFTNKRVVQETSYRDGSASVSYASAELVTDLDSNFKEASVLIIGLGDMGSDVARNLSLTDVTLCNRTNETANVLATELGFKTLEFKDLESHINEFDIILSAAQVKKPLVIKEWFEGKKIGLKYFIDLSIPRSIDEQIGKVPGVLLYNVDNIKVQTSETIKKRVASIPQVETIIHEALEDLKNWEQEMEVSPTINKLKQALEDIRSEEVKRYTKGLDAESLGHIESVTKSMMQKIIKLPVLQLKAACKRGEAETLIDVLNNLFSLEKDEEITQP